MIKGNVGFDSFQVMWQTQKEPGNMAIPKSDIIEISETTGIFGKNAQQVIRIVGVRFGIF